MSKFTETYARELAVAKKAAKAAFSGTSLDLCAGAVVRKKQCNAQWGGFPAYARYGLSGTFGAPECWERARAEASANCRPGRVDWTDAKTRQEKYEKKIKKIIKAAIRAALQSAGLKQPTRIFLANSAHHDYLGVADDGSAHVNQTPAESDELRAIRTRMNLTQVDLAKKLGVSGNHVARIERGERAPSETLMKLARILK